MPRITKYRMGVAAALLVVALAACDNDEGPSDEPQFTTMRLTVGAQVVNITRANCARDPNVAIQIPAAATTTVTAQYLLANGTADPLVTNADFELRVTSFANTGLATFATTGAHGGVFTRLAAGTTTATIALFHLGEGHAEVECVGVPLEVL